MKTNPRLNVLGSTIAFAVLLIFIFSCKDGSGGSSNNTSKSTSGSGSDSTSDSGNHHGPKEFSLVKIFSLPYRYDEKNILIDQNRIILAGGMKGLPAGSQHDGHLAFTDKVYVINLDTHSKTDYSIVAETGHPYGTQVGTGFGSQTDIRKLGNNQYLIYGGYQYAINTFILDLNKNTIRTYSTSNLEVNDHNSKEVSRVNFYTNLQSAVVFDNGGYAFFGYFAGLSASDYILSFDPKSKSYRILDTRLSIPRFYVNTFKLPDGKILLVGGADGSGATNSDSASRRTELYDPTTDSIERIENFPEPMIWQYAVGSTPTTSKETICVHNYTYSIADRSWSFGCRITSTNNKALYENTPYTEGIFLGRALNGYFLFLVRDHHESINRFNEECNCKPYSSGIKIHAYLEI